MMAFYVRLYVLLGIGSDALYSGLDGEKRGRLVKEIHSEKR